MKKLFTLIAAALMAVNVSAANKVLKITCTANKDNPWDSQCFINLKNLEKGKAYVVKFDVYTTAGTEFKIGTEAIDDIQTEHMNEWNNSAVFNYTEELTLTNQKSEAVINFPGKTKVTCHTHCTAKPGMEIDHTGGNAKNCDPEILENYEYAATALLLNIGKMPKDAVIYIGSIKVYDADGNLLSTVNFDDATVGEYDTTKTVHYPAWQNAATFEIVEAPTTGISNIESANVAKDGKSFNLAGQQVGKNYKGVVIKNGKKVVIK